MTQKHIPSEDSRRIVERAVAMGLDQDQISTLIGVTGKTLRMRYRRELDLGLVKLVSKIGDKLIDKIEAGDRASIFFFLKTRLGWSETGPAVNVAVGGQGPVLVVPGQLNVAEWNRIAEEHQGAMMKRARKLYQSRTRVGRWTRSTFRTGG